MSTIFSKIVRGEIPCYKVAEDEQFFAFLDAFPLVEGHTLVVTKNEIDNILSLDENHFAAFFLFARKIALAIERSFDCKKVGISVVGLEVPHAHIHLIPLNTMSDIDFSREKLSLPKERMAEIAKIIEANI